MNTPGIPTGSGTPSPPGRREVHLQGPRPSPLRVNKESHKIKKPPPVPRNHPQQQSQPLTLPAANDDRQPVIIYDVSPKVIHADASNFMSVVQQLTGNYSSIPSSSNDPFLGSGVSTGTGPPVSPAARLASIERTSPTERTRERNAANSELVGMLEDGIDVSSGIPGILSPAPSNLPGISSAMFSPLHDTQTLWGLQDYLMSSPVFGNSFIPSPYALLSSASPGVSPTIPSVDLFNFSDL